jgi:hypothetical protein
MPRRLHQTLADYVVIAISPALIMLLVGSLVYFLLAVFYQGSFQERLHWVMTCFVFAAVLIGRISIEEGYERAVLFGAPLAILMGIAANRFMEFHGQSIENFSWIINYTLIGIVWWCAHKLTWDCTVIDDAEDSSGEGLLQTAGLERARDKHDATVDADRRLEGTTSREVPASYWQRYLEHQRRPHAPGVWVVYFSLAALPIFGFGQWLIPATNEPARRYVFWLLCIYVASGLGLLVTTSFLGLRRYLRQRRIEMPTLMANLWLATGAAITLALLVAAALLPRPSAEYEISRLPFSLGSPDVDASSAAPSHREGADDENRGPAADRQRSDTQQAESQPTGEGNQPQGAAQGEDAAAARSGDPRSKGPSKDDQPSGQSGKQGSQTSDKPDNTAKDERTDDKDESGPDGQDDSPLAEQLRKLRGQEAEEKADEHQAADARTQDSPSEPISVPPLAQPAMGLLAVIFKWALYAVIALVVAYFLWKHWAAVAAAIRGFLAELGAWWNALWGQRRQRGAAPDVVVKVKFPPTPFASFADPFVSGLAERLSAQELVRYSFEAFEAWSREHGCPREPEQTAHELARDVARLNSFMAAEARDIAELFARAAYGEGPLPSTTGEQVRHLWRKMQGSANVRALASAEEE